MELKKSILDIFFPQFCLSCQKEGNYLCEDCKSSMEVLRVHKKYYGKNISDLYFALPYYNFLIKNLIKKFKYEPLIKELGKPLASLILEHLSLIDNKPDLNNFVLMPVPLEKRKLKWRGFNQAEEIAKELVFLLKIPLVSDVLIKTKETISQTELADNERKENVKNAFFCQAPEKIKSKKIILVDDVFTTGATMEECARILKQAGAKKIVGFAVARG